MVKRPVRGVNERSLITELQLGNHFLWPLAFVHDFRAKSVITSSTVSDLASACLLLRSPHLALALPAEPTCLCVCQSGPRVSVLGRL